MRWLWRTMGHCIVVAGLVITTIGVVALGALVASD